MLSQSGATAIFFVYLLFLVCLIPNLFCLFAVFVAVDDHDVVLASLFSFFLIPLINIVVQFLWVSAGVLTVFAHHRFANQSDGGRIIPSSLFARVVNQYFGINEQSVTDKSFRNTRLSGRLHYEP